MRWGTFVLTLDRAVSTNDTAQEYARRGAPHGSVFIAREQTEGRGRFGRRWVSLPGGLYLSVLLRPETGDSVQLLPHLASVAVAEALIETTAHDVRLRWPNDLFSGGRKLGGILCEGSFRGSHAEAFVVGIGINVNPRMESMPPDVRAMATGLAEYGLEEGDVAVSVIKMLETWWRRRDLSAIVTRFRELAEGDNGRAILVHPRDGEPYRAVSRGIADDGGLVIEIDDGARRILYSEDVVQLRDGDDGSR